MSHLEPSKPISVCHDVCQNAVFKTLKEHWICLKFTKTKISFLRCSMVESSWAKPRKSFHISHFQSNCEIFGNRSRLIELNFSKHQIDLTRKNSWWWSPKFKIKQDNLLFEQKCCNEFLNFQEYWFKHLPHMRNIRICIFLQDICKTNNFHLHHHLVAFTSTISCWGKSMHHKHIHHKAYTFAFASSWRTLVLQVHTFAFASV